MNNMKKNKIMFLDDLSRLCLSFDQTLY